MFSVTSDLIVQASLDSRDDDNNSNPAQREYRAIADISRSCYVVIATKSMH